MYLRTAISRCRPFIPLAVFCALTAAPVAQARPPEPDRPAAEGAVKELVRIEASGGKGSFERSITFYVISPDSKTVAYCEAVWQAEGAPARRELVLIDLETGKELRRRRVDIVVGGVFSPDGTLLALGCLDSLRGVAMVWDVGRWEPKVQLKRPEGHTAGCPLAFSPDGKLVAGRATRMKPEPWYTDDLILWDVATGDCHVLEDGDAKRFRPIGDPIHGMVGLVSKDGKVNDAPGPTVGPAPIAVNYPDRPGSGQLFVEYHARSGTGAYQGRHVFTTLWDTARGKALRTDFYAVGNLPPRYDMQYVGLAGRGAPIPGSGADMFRFRATPSGRISPMPKYHLPPISAVPYDDGTITVAVRPIEREFGAAVLCRLEDYKAKDPADGGITARTCRLSPDGRRLVALGIDPQTVKSKNPVRVLRVWDVSSLHLLAQKKMQKLTGAERERLWRVLFEDHPDPETATQLEFRPARYYLALNAMYSLVLHGDDAVAWLRQKLGPPFDLKQLPQLINDLDSPDFPTRERASRSLEQLGPLARSALESTLKKGPPPETKRRAEMLLARLQGTEAAYELRQLRIIDVLEHINTPAARELLQAIAGGSYDPAFAEEAKQALHRAAAKAR